MKMKGTAVAPAALFVACLTCWTWSGAEGANILAVISTSAQSHLNVMSAVTRGLAARGHDVTFICSTKPKGTFPPNHRLVVMGNIMEQNTTNNIMAAFLAGKSNPAIELFFLWGLGEETVSRTLSSPIFQAEVNKPGVKYDLVIVELFFFVEGFAALGHKLNAPVVGLNAFGTNLFVDDVMGNPVNPSWLASPFLGFTDHMTLYERTVNTLFAAYMYAGYHLYHLPKQQALVSKFFPQDTPTLKELLRTRVALALVNNHYTLFYPSPLSPNVVEIGGVHISNSTKPLPKDLQEYMDGAEHGVVYFSMGSNIQLKYLEKEKADAILGALGSLKQRVILKWDGPVTEVAPNIRIVDWAPQGDLLAHPNLRLFVSHGGLLSIQETIYNGVPIVGIPVFGDQEFNMLLAVNKGFGQKVGITTITREGFEAALKEVLNNPTYAQAAKRLSARFRNMPQRPLDTALFWLEHVLQYGGDHMKPSSVDLSLYQLLLLDVLFVLFAPVLVLGLCCRVLCCGRKKAKPVTASKSEKKTN